MESTSDLRRVWNQRTVPVLLRRGKGVDKRPRLRLPYEPAKRNNRAWIRNGRRHEPVWHSTRHYWEVPHAWFNDLVERCLDEFGKAYIIQPYREQEKCARACWEAKGHECQCSCMGANHGAGDSGGWMEVSETFASRWGDESLACRLLSRS